MKENDAEMTEGEKNAEETDKPSEPCEGEGTEDESDGGVILATIAAMDITGVDEANIYNLVCILFVDSLFKHHIFLVYCLMRISTTSVSFNASSFRIWINSESK